MESIDPSGTDRDTLAPSTWFAELKEAILHRTDTSKPGYCEKAKRELTRLSLLQKDNPGITEIKPDTSDLKKPSRLIADRYFAIYLTREYVNLPVFHLPALHAMYIELYTSKNPGDDKVISLGILNMIFALGCIAIDPYLDASAYFTTAQRLLRLGSLGPDSFSTIQAHILASQYLIAIHNFHAAWKSIGLAIRIAESLRLHLVSGSQHFEDRVDRELARRLWHSCILLERFVRWDSCTTD